MGTQWQGVATLATSEAFQSDMEHEIQGCAACRPAHWRPACAACTRDYAYGQQRKRWSSYPRKLCQWPRLGKATAQISRQGKPQASVYEAERKRNNHEDL